MAYSQHTEYPHGKANGDLTAQSDILDATAIDVAWITLANDTAGALSVTLSDVNASPTWTQVVRVPADSTVLIPSFRSDDGLRLSAAGVGIKYHVAYLLP